MTPTYDPSGPDDPVGVYLGALWVVPGPHEVTGTPPQVPAVPYFAPEGAVF